MEKYPDEHTVAVVRAAGSRDEKVTWLPLYELDRQFELDNLTSVYVPPLQGRDLKDFSELRQIIADLRGPEGCPWDKEQTHLSLKKYLIEECYEVLEAIDEEDEDHLVEELGDVLLQVMLHAQIGEDEGMFAIEDVMEALASKMIRRHPHVFGDAEVTDAEEVTKNWERIKAAEKPGTGRESLLNGVAKGMPALIRAYEIQKKAAKVGFDWEHAAEALEKVREELREFAAEIESGQRENEIAEFGDLLFAMINVARFLRIHPEEALEQTNQKFIRRFHFIEQQVKKSGRDFSDFSLEELNAFWNLAKKEERK
jgi:tetrapyrrole methylase family protein/MazG family protein